MTGRHDRSHVETSLRADDRLVGVLSRWLARHVSDEELLAAVDAVDAEALAPDQAEAVEELRSELERERNGRGELEMAVRETLEALALGG